MLGTMATVLSATVVNVALHDIMLEFGIRQGQVHWLATGFIAAMIGAILRSDILDITSTRILESSDDFLWPNELTVYKDRSNQEVMIVPDGFLTPGQSTGSLYLVRSPSKSTSKAQTDSLTPPPMILERK